MPVCFNIKPGEMPWSVYLPEFCALVTQEITSPVYAELREDQSLDITWDQITIGSSCHFIQYDGLQVMDIVIGNFDCIPFNIYENIESLALALPILHAGDIQTDPGFIDRT